MSKQRLDHCLLQRGLVKSRSQALRLIREGAVVVNGQQVEKPAKLIASDAEVHLTREDRYVSRAGEKLAAALDHFGVQAQGRRCLDVGASTGGFTDCLLQHGAASVLAIDVGHDQMDPQLVADERVRCLEGINARTLEPDAFGERFDLMVVDVSFISLTLVLPGMVGQAVTGCDLIALIKPQFELGSDALNRKGVVRAEADTQHAVDKVTAWFRTAPGWKTQSVMDSPIRGGDGNREYLIYAKRD